MKIRTEDGYYLKNADLVKEIIKFKKDKVASETLGTYLLSIANNLSTKGNFHGYTWRSDMVSEAVLTCIKYLKNFKPGKTSAFAYVTQICKHSFIAYIKTERKHSEIKDKCYKVYNDLVVMYNNDNDFAQKGDKKAIDYQQFGEKRRRKVVSTDSRPPSRTI